MTLRKILVDGLTVETTDAGVQAIEKLQGLLKDSNALVEAKDRENAELQGKLDRAVAKELTADALNKLVADRAKLVADARTVAPIDFNAGPTDADIRRAAVKAKLGDAAVEGKSDAYVEVRFDDLVKDAAEAASKKGGDPVRKVLGDGVKLNDGAGGWDDVLKSAGYAQ